MVLKRRNITHSLMIIVKCEKLFKTIKQLLKTIKQRFTFNCVAKVSAQTFSRGRRGLIQIYLCKLGDMTLRVPIQCNKAGISLNKIPKNHENKLKDLLFKELFRYANMRGGEG